MSDTRFIVRATLNKDRVFTNYEEANKYYESKLLNFFSPKLIAENVLVNGKLIKHLVLKKRLKNSLFLLKPRVSDPLC